jgi:Dihaem cytochrome c
VGITWKNLLALLIALGFTFAGLSSGIASDWETTFPKLKHDAWKEECGACHLAFDPSMLPARSWQKMMNELKDHFGDDASLDPGTRAWITEFLVTNAADAPAATYGMQRIARSIAPGAAPQRITETPFFKYFHEEVPAHIWQRKKIGTPANCQTCHTRANESRYVGREIRIPKE